MRSQQAVPAELHFLVPVLHSKRMKKQGHNIGKIILIVEDLPSSRVMYAFRKGVQRKMGLIS